MQMLQNEFFFCKENKEERKKQLNRDVYLPTRLSCFELVKNGLKEGFGVEPIDIVSISKPDSSPSHDNDSNS